MQDTPLRPAPDPVPVHAVWPFFGLAFALAWGLVAILILYGGALEPVFGPIAATHPMFILAVYSPAIAAFALVLWHAGVGGLGRYLTRLFLWRCGWAWAGFLLIGIPAIYFAGSAIKGNLASYGFPFDTGLGLLGALGFMLILGPVEEFGWRGMALPLLQRRLVPFWAGLLLGVIWGVWHLPAFFLSGTPQSAWGFTPFLAGAIAVSVILTPLFNRTQGSILMAVLFHFQLNNPIWPNAQPYDTLVFIAVAALAVWLNRDAMFTRTHAATRVVPI